MVGTFLNAAIDCYDDDASGAFPQLLFHPDLARANISTFDQVLILGCIATLWRKFWTGFVGTNRKCQVFHRGLALPTCNLPNSFKQGSYFASLAAGPRAIGRGALPGTPTA